MEKLAQKRWKRGSEKRSKTFLKKKKSNDVKKEMLKCLLITRKSKFNDTDRIEVECQVLLVNVLMPYDAFKEAYTHIHIERHIRSLSFEHAQCVYTCIKDVCTKIKPFERHTHTERGREESFKLLLAI